MGWICTECGAENDLSLCECEVCDTPCPPERLRSAKRETKINGISFVVNKIDDIFNRHTQKVSIALMALAFILLTVNFILNYKSIPESLEYIWYSLKRNGADAFSNLIHPFDRELLDAPINSISVLSDSLSEHMTDMWNAILDAIDNLLGMLEMSVDAFHQMINNVGILFESIKAAVMVVVNNISGVLSNV